MWHFEGIFYDYCFVGGLCLLVFGCCCLGGFSSNIVDHSQRYQDLFWCLLHGVPIRKQHYQDILRELLLNRLPIWDSREDMLSHILLWTILLKWKVCLIYSALSLTPSCFATLFAYFSSYFKDLCEKYVIYNTCCADFFSKKKSRGLWFMPTSDN